MAAAALVVMSSVASLWVVPRAAFGIFAGGGWNVLSFWCLAQLLDAWTGPQRSRRRVILWLVVKCPLLYGLAYALVCSPQVSLVGFGVGFSVVLLVMVGGFVWGAQRLIVTRHGQ